MILLHETCHSQGSIQMMGTKGTFGWGCATESYYLSSPIYTTEKTGSGPIKKWCGSIVYVGDNQVRLMIEKCNSTHAQNRRKVRQAHMKKMAWNKDAFTLHFRTAKGVRTHFLRFWSHSRLWPQNQKKLSLDLFHENMVWKVYTAKISGAYQLFYGSGPIFCSSVNGALSCLR